MAYESKCGKDGDIKVVYGTDDGNINKIFKFPSVIGITKKIDYIQDERIYSFNGYNYYVGKNALNLPSENLIDITDYKNLEYYAPLFLYCTIQTINIIPDIIVSGLSKSQIQNSGYFKEALKKFTVNSVNNEFSNIYILPQGAGSKLAIDKYGNNFPNLQKEFMGNTTFVGVDIGQNTIDTFLVTEGKTSPNLFEGVEKEGVMKIATEIAKKVKQIHNRQITLHEAKEIIDTGFYKLRGQKFDFKEELSEIKKSYLKNLLAFIENRYGNIIDKCDFISLSGGGSTIFKSTEDGFIRVPKNHHEYYNAIGQYLYGCIVANK